jgi:gamma-glutamyltranspeptidase/glutathione hydrolase
VLALGASGGPRIISSVLQVLLNMLEQQMPLADALAAVRVHHQWLPNELYFDQEPPPALLTGLQRAGNKISHVRKTGIVQAIQIQPDGTLLGASDPRKDGRPAGVP